MCGGYDLADYLYDTMIYFHIFIKSIVFTLVASFIFIDGLNRYTPFILLLIYLNVLSFIKIYFKGPGKIHPQDCGRYSLEEITLMDGTRIFIDLEDGSRKVDLAKSTNFLKYSKNVYKQFYCTTCNIFKPPGVSHCGECHSCIFEKDHHCPSLNTCIGRNNYIYFLFYLKTDFILSIYTFKSFVVKIIPSYWQLMFPKEGVTSLFPNNYSLNTLARFSLMGLFILICASLTCFIIFSITVCLRFHGLFLLNLKSREFILKTKEPDFSFESVISRMLTIKSPLHLTKATPTNGFGSSNVTFNNL